MRLHQSYYYTRLTSSGVENAFYFHFNTRIQTQNFRGSSQRVSTPYRYDLGPRSEPFSRKTANNFHQAKTESTRLPRVTQLHNAGAACIVLASWKTNPKRHSFVKKNKTNQKKKHPRQRGPAMRVLQSGRCRDQACDNTRHAVQIIHRHTHPWHDIP